MSSKIFNALLEEKIENLISAYQNTSRTVFFDDKEKRLIHSGEFGAYREKLVKDFLRFIIPQKLAINNGFIISSTDEISTQCDIIIYDHNITPLIQSNELQTFYPVETVVGIGEVKSKLSKAEFVTAINKLARIKEIKSRVPFPGPIDRNRGYDYNPEKIPFDNIFTFIFCEKFNFNYDTIEIDLDDMYEKDIAPWNRHNLIFSIEDGLLLYTESDSHKDFVFYAPILKGVNLHKFLRFDETKKYHHFKTFALSLFDGISNATVLYPEISNYMTGITPQHKL